MLCCIHTHPLPQLGRQQLNWGAWWKGRCSATVAKHVHAGSCLSSWCQQTLLVGVHTSDCAPGVVGRILCDWGVEGGRVSVRATPYCRWPGHGMLSCKRQHGWQQGVCGVAHIAACWCWLWGRNHCHKASLSSTSDAVSSPLRLLSIFA